jgi:hypothetical protein
MLALLPRSRRRSSTRAHPRHVRPAHRSDGALGRKRREPPTGCPRFRDNSAALGARSASTFRYGLTLHVLLVIVQVLSGSCKHTNNNRQHQQGATDHGEG